jgi:ElaB/YqjD/DUF883 family membrane-anchored ribosome-binding protein
MESTYEKLSERMRDHNGEAMSEQAGKVAGEWHNLIADVEDLVKKIANVGDAEVARVRARVERTLETAKSAAARSASTARDYAQQATARTDEYVHESPWTAVGLAAAVGVLIGFIAARR